MTKEALQPPTPNTSGPLPHGDALITYKKPREGKTSEGIEKEGGISLDIKEGNRQSDVGCNEGTTFDTCKSCSNVEY